MGHHLRNAQWLGGTREQDASGFVARRTRSLVRALREGIGEVMKRHSEINELILTEKDLTMFPIVRVNNGTEKYWQVTDLRSGVVRRYRTRFEAETAICSVVRFAMEVGA